MKAVTIERPMINERSRPSATGANRMRPQDRYQGWTTGPRTTKSSRVSPTALSAPIRSLLISSQTPATAASRSPSNRVTVSTPPRPTPMWKKWATPVKTSARTSVGAVHERTAPGVSRMDTHPHPRPLT